MLVVFLFVIFEHFHLIVKVDHLKRVSCLISVCLSIDWDCFVVCGFRLPVELGGALSLMPLHSVTASALFTSLLSLNNVNWGCLSEGTLLL